MEMLKRMKHKGIKVRVVPHNPSSGHVLTSAPARLQEAHAVVISGLYKKDDTSADAQVTLLGLLLMYLQCVRCKYGGSGCPAADHVDGSLAVMRHCGTGFDASGSLVVCMHHWLCLVCH